MRGRLGKAAFQEGFNAADPEASRPGHGSGNRTQIHQIEMLKNRKPTFFSAISFP
jgi:hypothetical protein